MIRTLLCCLLSLQPLAVFSQIPLGIGEWRTHVPHGNATSLADAGDKMYVSTNVFFFSYEKASGAVLRFDKVLGLSDVGVSSVHYNSFNRILLVAYENANIDLIEESNLYNISDIKRKQMIGGKKINDVFFLGNLAYLSCSFGIVLLDMKKLEIKDTYRISSDGSDVEVYSFTADSTWFYAATEQGLKVANRNSANLANFSEWTLAAGLPLGKATEAVNFQNHIFACVKDSLFENAGNSWQHYYSDTAWKIVNITSDTDNMVICETSEVTAYQGRIGIISDNFICCNYRTENITIPGGAFVENDSTAWVADLLNGLLKLTGNQAVSYVPNGPFKPLVQNMDVKRNQLWTVPGGVTSGFDYSYNGDGASVFNENWWSARNRYTHPELTSVLGMHDVAVHPTLDIVYIASWWDGLVEYSNGTFTIYNKDNSIIDASGDTNRTIVSGVTFDSNQNLWLTAYSAPHPIVVKKNDGTWKEFFAPGVDNNWLSQIIIDDYNQKWMIIPKTNNQGLLVFDSGNDIDNTSDDRYKIYSSGTGNGNLPSNEVLCLAKDNEGEIWVGTAQGVAVFYCASAVFSEQGCEAQQIIVTQNGVAGYLLETERVNTIAVDDANRKWVGTNNGVFLLSPDGTEQIAYYTADNSPLLSNVITDIAINHQTGEVFIGTERGLVSIRGEAAAASENECNAFVFPNPVKKDYEGTIAINGLANNANVKITDINGMLFFETTALGGQAVWNGRNYNGAKAKTGVYLVFASNEDGSSTCITKLLIVN